MKNKHQTILTFFIFIFVALLPSICFSSSRVGKANAQIKLLENSLYMLAADTCNFPTSNQGLELLVINESQIANWDGPYLNKQLPLDPWQNGYKYIFPSQYGTKKFDLYSFGQDGIDNYGENDDVSNWQGYDKKYYPRTPYEFQNFVFLILLLDFPITIIVVLIYFVVRKLKLHNNMSCPRIKKNE